MTQQWKFADQANTVVVAELEGGGVQSMLAGALPPETAVLPYAAPAALVPTEVSMAQAQIALMRAGVSLATVSALIDGIADAQVRAEARVWWEKSNAVKRNHPVVAMLAPGLGLSSAQVDALFIAAAAI